MDRSARRIALHIPVIVLVLAFTAVPIEVRPVSINVVSEFFGHDLDIPDIIENIVGYLPLGAVLASRGIWSATTIAAGVSLFAEVSQLFSAGRSPSLIDVATNILGAFLGSVIAARWGQRTASIGPRAAGMAAALAVALAVAGDRASAQPAWLQVNAHGSTSPGQLEAHWTFDDRDDRRVLDASGSGLNGVLVNGTTFVPGVSGQAVRLNGRNQWVDLGDPVALRFTGSMTISAWINSRSFPRDDAAIVSNFNGLGYQLDTTVDRGQRTIGFKLGDPSGRLMARYGRTRLRTGRWYHVAGVYDARAQTLNVYLNGQLDNGCLLGTVASSQHLSGEKVFIGRHGQLTGYAFAGLVDDVRIYSQALSQHDLEAEVGRVMPGLSTSSNTGHENPAPSFPNSAAEACAPIKPPDARISGLVVVAGMITAIACVAFWPTTSYRTSCYVLSLLVSLLLVPSLAPVVPPWSIPLLALAGAAAVAMSTTG